MKGDFSLSPLLNISPVRKGQKYYTAPLLTFFFFFLSASSLETKGCIGPHLIMLFTFELALLRLYSLMADKGGSISAALLSFFGQVCH